MNDPCMIGALDVRTWGAGLGSMFGGKSSGATPEKDEKPEEASPKSTEPVSSKDDGMPKSVPLTKKK